MMYPQMPPDLLARFASWLGQFPGGELLFTVLMFVLVLSFLVFVHELGHYLAAKRMGVQVQAFSIGFGRALLKWRDRAGTEWRVGWLPLGGYVQMLGQADLKPVTASAQPGHYMSKGVGARAFIISAGPLANLLLGWVLLWGAFAAFGEQRLRAEVGEILPNMPAADVLQVGDVVLSVNGAPVRGWGDFQGVVSEQGGQPVQLTVRRGAEILPLTLTPETVTSTDLFGEEHQVGRVGVAPTGALETVVHGPLGSATRALERTAELTELTVTALWRLLTGRMAADNLAGPLGIADLTGDTAQVGFYALLVFAALISINLCVVNLFPLPILDGGHLVLLLYEKLRGRPLGARAQEWAMRVGLACILLLAAFATVNDVQRLMVAAEDTGTATAPGTGSPAE